MVDRERIIEDILRRLSSSELEALSKAEDMARLLHEAGVEGSRYTLATPKTRRRVVVGSRTDLPRSTRQRRARAS